MEPQLYKKDNEIKEKDLSQQDFIQKVIGSFGTYQLCICVLIFISKFPVAFHQLAILFLSPRVEYTCLGSYSNETCPCPEPQYDTSIFTNTIIMEWDLICDRRWLTSFTQTLFQFGTLLGSVLFGMASDRFGRKKPLLLAVLLQISMGITAAYIPDFWTFTFIRFLIGMSAGGTMVVGFVILIEFVGTKYRGIVSGIYQVHFNLGNMLLPVFGYFFRDYTKFQLAISVPTVILLSYFFLIPDSPRWLIAMKRKDEAIAILERAAKVNNRSIENIRKDVELFEKSLDKDNLKKGSLLDLFKTPNLRKNLAAMSFNWLTCSYCFYGVSQYVGQLSGDVFTNVTASASMSLLGGIVSIPLLRFFGRRTIFIVFNFLSALCLFILSAIPEGIASVICASIGVFTSFVVFVTAYLYCSELFPTVVRNAALGFSSMMARVGSMIAPFVIELRDVSLWMPPVFFAVPLLIAAVVSFVLPETFGCELITTIEEGEQFGKKKSSNAT